MNFQSELADLVLDGRKSVTRRIVSDNPRSPYHPNRIGQMIGKRIAVCPGRGKRAVGTVRVTSVRRQRFDPDFVTDDEAAREGFTTAEAFAETWGAMHGSLDVVEVWRIELAYPEASDA